MPEEGPAGAVVETDEGPVTFKETTEPITQKDYIDNRKQRKNVKLYVETNISRVKSEITGGTDKFLGAISTRLGNISKRLKTKLRLLDFDISRKSASDIKAVLPLLRAAKSKMSKDDFADWDYARKNSDVNKINELIEKYGIRKEYDAYRKVLDRIRSEAYDVGLSIGKIEEYAPRVLKRFERLSCRHGKRRGLARYTPGPFEKEH
jgi:hypothetical protein